VRRRRLSARAEGGRLNVQSVLLEGGAAQSQGGTARLDLSKCEQYRLLPGQVRRQCARHSAA
jgi:hypothetical protein